MKFLLNAVLSLGFLGLIVLIIWAVGTWCDAPGPRGDEDGAEL